MRPTCDQCEYILDRCICEHLCKIESPIPIIILRDPKEKNHALGTAHLLKLCIKNIKIIDTDNPDQDFEFINFMTQFKNPILIYPFEQSQSLNETKKNNSPDCLIFLDGTWKKTNRLFFRSQVLQKLTRCHLDLINFQTNYRLRKSTKENSLSTIEAVGMSLNTLTEKDFSELNHTFEKFINKQIELMNKKKGV